MVNSCCQLCKVDAGVTTRKEKKEKKDKKEKKEQKEDREGEDEDKDDEANSSGADSEDDNEINIDLNEPLPLSKKEKRLLKKGKLDKIPKKKLKVVEVKPANAEGDAKGDHIVHSVWVGNLSFDTQEQELKDFIVVKSEDLHEKEPEKYVAIEETDFTRVKMPKQKTNVKKIKGFAYIDFKTEQQKATAIAVSENALNGRNLLIKDANNYEGRPEVSKSEEIEQGTPSRILFVGNLSFETLEEDLEKQFRHCGEIYRIRMATFEDSGKCKGFAFIDFNEVESVTRALRDKLCKKLMGRTLKLQYGEDRSKRAPRASERPERGKRSFGESFAGGEQEGGSHGSGNAESFGEAGAEAKRPRKTFNKNTNSSSNYNRRVKSSVALATAQRASAAIVPSQGKKKTFD